MIQCLPSHNIKLIELGATDKVSDATTDNLNITLTDLPKLVVQLQSWFPDQLQTVVNLIESLFQADQSSSTVEIDALKQHLLASSSLSISETETEQFIQTLIETGLLYSVQEGSDQEGSNKEQVSLPAIDQTVLNHLTRTLKPTALQQQINKAHKLQAKNDFAQALTELKSAQTLVQTDQENSLLQLRFARTYNGEGAYHLHRGERDLARQSYESAKKVLVDALDKTDEPELSKSLSLQQYFNATGFYHLDNNTGLHYLNSARAEVTAKLTSLISNYESTEENKPTLIDPEAASDTTKLSTTAKHELAYMLIDRPEGESPTASTQAAPLSQARTLELERGIALYKDVATHRTGYQLAMTYSRLVDPLLKLEQFDEALQYLEQATELFIEIPHGQRLDILERDLTTFKSVTTLSTQQQTHLHALEERIHQAKSAL